MPKPYNPHDKLMMKAKEKGFRARSVFKLMELDERFKLFKPGQKVLDIGAAPGSWLQYVSQKIHPSGLAIGVDLQSIVPIAGNVKTKVVDINDALSLEQVIKDNKITAFDLVLSDIAPNTSGIKEVDNQKSLDLSKSVFEISLKYLKKSGILIMKIFQGQDLGKFMKLLKESFGFVTAVKVKSSRDRSREVYLVCLRKKDEPQIITPQTI